MTSIEQPQANSEQPFTLADFRGKEQPENDPQRLAAWSSYLRGDLVASGVGPATQLLKTAIEASDDEQMSGFSLLAFELLDEARESMYSPGMLAAKRMLSAQAVALNAIFAERTTVALAGSDDYNDAMHLALQAQAQCVETIKALAAIPTAGGREGGANGKTG